MAEIEEAIVSADIFFTESSDIYYVVRSKDLENYFIRKYNIYLRIYAFNKNTICFETNAIRYYDRYDTLYKDNISKFIDDLKEHYDEKTVKEIESDLRKIHRLLLKKAMLKKIN